MKATARPTEMLSPVALGVTAAAAPRWVDYQVGRGNSKAKL